MPAGSIRRRSAYALRRLDTVSFGAGMPQRPERRSPEPAPADRSINVRNANSETIQPRPLRRVNPVNRAKRQSDFAALTPRRERAVRRAPGSPGKVLWAGSRRGRMRSSHSVPVRSFEHECTGTGLWQDRESRLCPPSPKGAVERSARPTGSKPDSPSVQPIPPRLSGSGSPSGGVVFGPSCFTLCSVSCLQLHWRYRSSRVAIRVSVSCWLCGMTRSRLGGRARARARPRALAWCRGSCEGAG